MAYMNNRGPPPVMGGGGSNGAAADLSKNFASMHMGPMGDGAAKKYNNGGSSFSGANVQEFVPASASSTSSVPGLRQPNTTTGNMFHRQTGLMTPSAGLLSGSNPSSARHSPTPSSTAAASHPGASGAAAAAGADMDPNAIAAYSDGGTTYFYSGDEMVRVVW